MAECLLVTPDSLSPALLNLPLHSRTLAELSHHTTIRNLYLYWHSFRTYRQMIHGECLGVIAAGYGFVIKCTKDTVSAQVNIHRINQ